MAEVRIPTRTERARRGPAAISLLPSSDRPYWALGFGSSCPRMGSTIARPARSIAGARGKSHGVPRMKVRPGAPATACTPRGPARLRSYLLMMERSPRTVVVRRAGARSRNHPCQNGQPLRKCVYRPTVHSVPWDNTCAGLTAYKPPRPARVIAMTNTRDSRGESHAVVSTSRDRGRRWPCYIPHRGKDLRPYVANDRERNARNNGISRHSRENVAMGGEREFVYKKIVSGTRSPQNQGHECCRSSSRQAQIINQADTRQASHWIVLAQRYIRCTG